MSATDKNYAQFIQGTIKINGTNYYEKTVEKDGSIKIVRDNIIRTFIHRRGGGTNPKLRYINLSKQTIKIRDKSIKQKNKISFNYEIESSFQQPGNLHNYSITEYASAYITNQLTGSVDPEDPTVKSKFYLKSPESGKLTDFYSFKQPTNKLFVVKEGLYSVENADYTYMSKDKQQIKVTEYGDEKGIILHPSIETPLVLEDTVNVNKIDLVVRKTVENDYKVPGVVPFIYPKEKPQKYITELKVTKDEIMAYTTDQLRGYIEKHEKVIKKPQV